MTVRVKLFAAARQLAGRDEVVVQVDDHATIAEVERELLAAAPSLAPIVPHARWAIDAEFVDNGATVTGDSEIALIPPVSGG